MKQAKVRIGFIIGLVFLALSGLVLAAPETSYDVNYNIYYGHIDTVEYSGSDGIPDLLLKAEHLILIAANITTPILVDNKYQDIALCGLGDGTYVECTPVGEVDTRILTKTQYNYIQGDFNGDSVTDLLLQAQTMSEASFLFWGSDSGQLQFGRHINEIDGNFLTADITSIFVKDENGDGKDDLRFDNKEIYYATEDGEFISSESSLAATPLPTALVGATQAYSTVTPSGAFNYSIPLYTPTGPGGLKPDLALVYSSLTSSGIAGSGWNLGGLSEITVCPKHSNGVKNISFQQYCMDGEYLVPDQNEAGVYHSEVETFKKIKKLATSFEVRSQDGKIYTYGQFVYLQGAGPTLPAKWLLTNIADRSGNAISIEYKVQNGDAVPTLIQYGQEQGVSIVFEYGIREDLPTMFLYRGSMRRTSALTKVLIKNQGIYIREYILGYGNDPYSTETGKLQLKFVQECGYSENGIDIRCLNPTQFSWNSDIASAFPSQSSFAAVPKFSSSAVENERLTHSLPLNWNNDGYQDLLTMNKQSLKIQFGSANGLREGEYWVYSSGIVTRPTPIDFNDDGIDDLIFFRHSGDNNRFWSLVKRASITRSTYDGNSIQGSGIKPGLVFQYIEKDPWVSSMAYNIDVNNDGKRDVFYPTYGEGRWRLAINNGRLDANTPEDIYLHSSSKLQIKFTPYTHSGGVVGDFDLDGSEDILFRDGSANDFKLVGFINEWDGTKWKRYYTIKSIPLPSSAIDFSKTLLADINGDGYQDLLADINGELWVYRNLGGVFDTTGINTALRGVPFLPMATRASGDHIYSIRVIDFDGNGIQDLFYSSENPDGSKTYKVILSRGDYLESPLDTGIIDKVDWTLTNLFDRLNDGGTLATALQNGTAEEQAVYKYLVDLKSPIGFNDLVIMDLNGDGEQDILQVNASGDGWDQFIQQRGKPEQIIEVENGLGTTTSIKYKPLTDSSVYEGQEGDVAFPARHVRIPLHVVSQLESQNGLLVEGIPQVNKNSYFYKGAKYTINGRGFLGFAEQKTINHASGMTYQTRFKQNYPFIGMPFEEQQLITATGQLVKRKQTIWQRVHTNPSNYARSAYGEPAYFPYPEQSTEENFDLNGQAVHGSKTLNTFDGFGNLTSVVMEVGQSLSFDSAGVATVNQLAQTTTEARTILIDQTNWLISFLSNRTISYQHPGEVARTYTSTFIPKPGTLLIDTETRFSGLPDLQQTIQYDYDIHGNLLTSSVTGNVDADGDGTTEAQTRSVGLSAGDQYLYGVYPTRLSNALGHSDALDRQYDYRNDQVVELTDPNGLTVYSSYDQLGRQIKKTDPDGTNTLIEYAWCTAACPLSAVYWVSAEVRHSALSGPGQPDTVTYYDLLGREVRQQIVNLDGSTSFVDTEYDALGRVFRKSTPYRTGETPQYTEFNFDELGRKLNEIRPAGKGRIDYTYASTSAGGLRSTRIETINKADMTSRQLRTVRVKNVLGQISQVIDDENALSVTTDYTYDAQGNLVTTQVDSNIAQTTSATFDVAGNRTYFHDPNTGERIEKYDAFGNLREQTDGKGQLSRYVYDKLSRLISRVEDVGSRNFTAKWIYDQDAAQECNNTPAVIGKLLCVKNPDFRSSIGYDPLSRVVNTATEITVNGVTSRYTNTATYDAFSRVLTQTSPSGYATKQTYLNGYAHQLLEDGSQQVLLENQNADSAGRITQSKLGNGLVTTRSYDSYTGLINTLHTTAAGLEPVQNLAYQWHSNGNLDNRKMKNGTGAVIREETFAYDTINRLLTANTTGDLSRNESFTYYRNGNVKTKYNVTGTLLYGEAQGANNNAGSYAVTSANGKTYQYDGNGNMILRGGDSIMYTPFNKPEKIYRGGILATTFHYGPEHQRYYQKTVTSSNDVVETYYVGSGFEEIILNGQFLEQNTYVGDFMVHKQGASSAYKHYLHRDHLGSVEAITNQSATLVERLAYDAWGQRRTDTWADGGVPSLITSRGFTGHEHLDETGLIHMNGRVYDPLLGRFLSADIVVQAPYFSQSFNRYSYVWNNPLSATDPSGFYLDPLTDFELSEINIPQTLNYNIYAYSNVNHIGNGNYGSNVIYGSININNAATQTSGLDFSLPRIGTSEADYSFLRLGENSVISNLYAQHQWWEGWDVAQKGFGERFQKITGMSVEDSISLYKSQTGETLTVDQVQKMFTDPQYAKEMLMANENLHKIYRNDILNSNAPQSIADAKARGFVQLPVYKSVFHNPWYNPWGNSKWVGPSGHMEVVFSGKGSVVSDIKYMGTFNFFGPDQASAHWAADVEPYQKWGN